MLIRHTVVFVFFITSPMAFANDILGVKIEVANWEAQITGDFQTTSPLSATDDTTEASAPTRLSTHNAQINDEVQTVIGLTLNHSLPLLPKIRYRETQLAASGRIISPSIVTFGDTSFDAQSNLIVDLDLGYQQINAYYPVFEHWISIDLGVVALNTKGSISIENASATSTGGETAEGAETASTTTTVGVDDTSLTPFIQLKFDIPKTPFVVLHEQSYGNSGEEDFSGRETKLRFQRDKRSSLYIEAGYKKQKLISSSLGDIESALFASGAYVSLIVSF